MCKYCELDTSDDTNVHFCDDMNHPITLTHCMSLYMGKMFNQPIELPICQIVNMGSHFNQPLDLPLCYLIVMGHIYNSAITAPICGGITMGKSFNRVIDLPSALWISLYDNYQHRLYLPKCVYLMVKHIEPNSSYTIHAPVCYRIDAISAEVIVAPSHGDIITESEYISTNGRIITEVRLKYIRCGLNTIIATK